MRKAIIFFCLLIVVISVKAEANIEKIGTKKIEILLSEDYPMKEGIEVPFLLRNASEKEQHVYFELTGFKTKENKMVVAEFSEKEKCEPCLTYNGKPQLIAQPSKFEKGEIKSFTLNCKLIPDSDKYTGTLNIYAFPKDDKDSIASSNFEILFTIEKAVKPKKEPPELNLEINDGIKDAIYISKVIKVFPAINEDNQAQKEAYNIDLANKTKDESIKNISIKPSFLRRVSEDKKINEKFDPHIDMKLPLLESNRTQAVSLPIPDINEPGTYNIGFKINAEGIESQQIEVTVYAKYGHLWAVVVLLFGGIVSYFFTRIYSIAQTKRQRSNLIDRINSEVENYIDDNDYLKERIRALTSLSRNLNRSWLFIGREETRGFLELAEYLLSVGKRKGEIWHELQLIKAPQGLVDEASAYLKEVDWHITKYNVLAQKAEIDSRLDKAEACSKKDKRDSYWSELKKRIEKLLKKIQKAGDLPHSDLKGYAEELKNNLEKHKNRAEIKYDELKPIEQMLIELDLLWRHKDKLNALNKEEIDFIKNHGDEADLKNILMWKKENESNWEKIKKNNEKGLIRIRKPATLTRGVVAVFAVDFGDEKLNSSFLVRRKLTYDWEFIDSSDKDSIVPPSFDMKTNSLAKYFPKPGNYDLFLKITYLDEDKGSPIEIEEKTVEVHVNEDLKRIRQISKVELWLALAAMVLAVLSGLQTEYFTKPDFGSSVDLIALFLWAVAFDQGKNMIGWAKQISEAQKQP